MKLATVEEGSAEVEQAIERASGLAGSRIAYVECRSAVARAAGQRRLTAAAARRARRILDEVWAEVAVVELDASLAAAAAALAGRHLLRGMDAIHLASALATAAADAREETVFACWNERLRAAARRERLPTLPAV